jgi:hypothetical protein
MLALYCVINPSRSSSLSILKKEKFNEIINISFFKSSETEYKIANIYKIVIISFSGASGTPFF